MVVEANETCLAFLGLAARPPGQPGLRLPGPAALATRPCASSMSAAAGKPSTVVRQIRLQAAVGEVPVELHMRPTASELLYTAIVDLSERERMER